MSALLPRPKGASGLSYKYQRLRERIRQAVISGELTGKLPGERELARRFHANAKTLSKALTDLAAEGLLWRSIGRGTFVQGAQPESRSQQPWLVLCPPQESESPVVRRLLEANPGSQLAQDVTTMRPSFLNQFGAVVDLSCATPDRFIRDLVVRNVPVVCIGREPKTYSTNAVLIDKALGAAHIGRTLMLAGHRRLAAVEPRGQTVIAEALRRAAARCAPDATVDPCFSREAPFAIESGITAIVCDTAAAANETVEAVRQAGMAIPAQVSVCAIGLLDANYPCTGYYVPAEQMVAAILDLLQQGPAARPTTLWLVGAFVDVGSIAAAQSSDDSQRGISAVAV